MAAQKEKERDDYDAKVDILTNMKMFLLEKVK